MQTNQLIALDQVRAVVSVVFEQGQPIVSEAYSAFSSPTLRYENAEDLCKDIFAQLIEEHAFCQYTVYYPDAKGHVYEKRIQLNPDCCDGHKFRFSQEGWGLIDLQLRLLPAGLVECRVALNSPARAKNWSTTNSEYRAPDLWDWGVLRKKAGKLVRLVRKLGNTTKADHASIEQQIKRDPVVE